MIEGRKQVTSSIPTAVVLAAGLGTRMKSRTPKVLHEVCGVPLLSHILEAVGALQPERLVVVLGPGHERVEPHLPESARVALQLEPRGTGDAVLKASGEILDGPMLVLPGDTPLITAEVLDALVAHHRASEASATLLTMILDDPSGYGRIIRDDAGDVTAIVEHRDADAEQRRIKEVNAGMYVLPGRRTLELLRGVGDQNDQGEVYLTDVIAALRAEGLRVSALPVADPTVTLGVNSRVELAEAQGLMRARILEGWMREGVTIEDPASTFIDARVRLSADVRILPFSSLRGETAVGRGSEIGPGSSLTDTLVGEGARVIQSHTERARIGDRALVGPFSYLSPKAPLEDADETGAFVQIENGTAVAPFSRGDGVTIGAGSVITQDVAEGKPGSSRTRQESIPGYTARAAEPNGEDGQDGT